jgi:hypothetical protein
MKSVSFVDLPTECVPFIASAHRELRRHQRNIGIEELKAAMKHGERNTGSPRPNGSTTSRFTYNGIVYIVDDVTGEEVTCYTVPEELVEVSVSPEDRELHNNTKEEILSNLACRNSNTVVVVDTSGSMRTADVQGSRTRLHAVWAALANDYVFQRIEEGTGGLYDVVSIISLGESAETLLLNEPASWILYNKILKMHNSGKHKQCGHGNYPESGQSRAALTSKRVKLILRDQFSIPVRWQAIRSPFLGKHLLRYHYGMCGAACQSTRPPPQLFCNWDWQSC